MTDKRSKARWRCSRAASNPVAKPEVPASSPALPVGWSRWDGRITPPAPPVSAWVPADCNRHLKDAARGLESIGYPLLPPPAITLPRRHGRSAARC